VERDGLNSARVPPPVFQLAGHPLRWRLLCELAASDRRVSELVQAVAGTQPLVSYHLARLRGVDLVSARRSSFDARDSYYSLNLPRCRDLLAAGSIALHPALRPGPPPVATRRRARLVRVLFLCTGNSARSQIAEALLRHLSDGSVRAFSAGSHPKPLHPSAVRVMNARGIDISKRKPRHLDSFSGKRFDYVISLCDKVREVCPDFPGAPQTIHWSIADPAATEGNDSETYPAFEQTAAELETRIGFLLHRINEQIEEKEVARS
jgi:ArsR family transcriptional regulator, arsenate/arsenite/antimonite-responsive transcriptional repressor / arsenate reductase (thioredoxin)